MKMFLNTVLPTGLVGLAVAYSILLVALVLLESRLVFPAPAAPLSPSMRPEWAESVHFRSEDGTRLRALYFPAQAGAPTVLYFTGNGTDASRAIHGLQVLHGWGAGALVLDYRGYGDSEGSPSEQGLMLDAEAAWQYLTRDREVPQDEIVLFGHSLGSGPATWLATQHTARLLVVESAYTALPDVAAATYPIFPVHWVMQTRFPNLERIKKARMPVLVAHSREDHMIPFSHGEALAEAAGHTLDLLELAGGHNASALHDPKHQDNLKRFMFETQAD